MAELTIDAADIAAVLRKSVEGFRPSIESEQVGRVLEVGDGIARVAGLPNAAVNELLEGRALPITKAAATFIVGAGRGHDLPAIIDKFVDLAAQNREHAIAEVRSAVALDDSQRQRIGDALSRATGKNVEVKVIIDESVLGGIVATIGDTVIDGTVRHRLDQLKEQI